MRSVALHLAVRNWLARPLRPVLCSLAIAAAVALVVCVGAGIDSMLGGLATSIGQLLGHADVYVRPAFKAANSRLPGGMVADLRANPEVERVSGRMETQISLRLLPAGTAAPSATMPSGTSAAIPSWVFVVGMDPAEDDYFRPKNVVVGKGLGTNQTEILIDSNVARNMGAHAGDSVEVTDGVHGTRTARIAGVVASPGVELLQKPTAYFPIGAICKDLAVAPAWNVIDLKLKPGVETRIFARHLQKELGATVTVTSANEGQQKLQNDAEGASIILALLSVISAVCASLIIGTTLSVGVQERVRQFGHLRCIGASRVQLLGMLVADAVLLMVLGTALGLVFGLILAHLAVWHYSKIFMTFEFSFTSLLMAIGNGVLATLIGSLIPAWQVLRITPMQAVQSVARATPRRHVRWVGILGVGLIALQILLWCVVRNRDLRVPVYAVVGIPSIFLGYALLGPSLLLVLEKVLHRPLALLMGIRAPLLRNAWSRTPWRSGGMIAALMIGVTLLVAVRGRSAVLLNSWNFPEQFPDLLLFRPPIFTPPGDPVPGLKRLNPAITDATAVGIFSAKVKSAADQIMPGQKSESTNFVAVDPTVFLKMVKMEFVQGDEKSALAKLADPEGHALLIAQEFQLARGIGVGDHIPLQVPGGAVVNFDVVGVVASSGVNLVKNYFDLRSSFQEQAVSSVLGSQAAAEKFFKVHSFNIVLANLTPGADVKAVRAKCERLGWQNASAVEMKLKIGTVIEHFADAMSIIGISAMCVASLGVANMVIASIQARRYEFGILRAIGAGRGQLIRLVLAETSLICIAAATLGTLAGLHFVAMASQVDRVVIGFKSTFISSWKEAGFFLLLYGASLVVTLLLGSLASLIPAWRGAVQAQQTMLAGGRG